MTPGSDATDGGAGSSTLSSALGSLRFLPLGSEAVLVETADLESAMALFAALVVEPVAGIVDVVPAARTVAVRFRPSLLLAESVVAIVRRLHRVEFDARSGRLVTIPVTYDGDDLAEVASLTGLEPDEVVARHTAATYTVAFTGFAPGFAYLAGGDPELAVPRRSTPRIAIPAGAVGMAGEFSGVYPRVSPGGWHVIGRTALPMWDLAHRVPALLQPGMRVRFVDVRDPEGVADAEAEAHERAGETGSLPVVVEDVDDSRALIVRAPGTQTMLEDLGRPGRAGLGVSPSGAMDHRSLREANRLVGAPAEHAALEIAYGGLEIETRGSLVAAVAGAPVGLLVTARDGSTRRPVPGAAFALDDGDVLRIEPPARGVYAYLAVRGGFTEPAVLDSVSGDVLSGLGHAPLVAGDELPIGTAWAQSVALDASDSQRSVSGPDEVTLLDIVLGPRDDWFDELSLTALTTQEWTVTPRSNRTGLRLHGDTPLERALGFEGELPSEATISGGLQIPPDGQPVLFMADHPVTGGYPVIACVTTEHLDRAAQVPIGARVRFRVVVGPSLGGRHPSAEARPERHDADERGEER
ncbi:carboxyltransferase domain-containing protein [Frigoribacterium sp. 2-23]|uniref:5-oxoprolinase subunit B/C family protein n=1 Tax=Frigoribacterium sp. 2-23 TaxID=3415006 RepID=UPI003C6FB8DF